MSWLAFRIHPGTNREGVLEALFAAGSQGIEEIGGGDEVRTHFPHDVDAGALIGSLLAASPDARVETMPVADVDWSEQWKQGVHAQRLGPLVIAPPWLAAEHDGATTIVIDPGMAFGTGEHATTRGVVRLMPSVVRAGDHVADLGAGSAVLSIAAAKLGAARVIAIEIDPDAIGNAEENVRRNGVADRVTVVEGDAELLLPLVAPVRVALANILSSVLVSLLPAIAGALSDEGRVILSGILVEDRAGMLAILAECGWAVEAEDREEIWWSVVIGRR